MSGTAALANIAALRAAATGTVPQGQCYLAGYYAGADGGEGQFWYNSSDTTSADNGGTIIVNASGRRWYRETGRLPCSVRWFGPTGNGSTNDYTAFHNCSQAAITAGGGNGTAMYVPIGQYVLGTSLVIDDSNFLLVGEAAGSWIVNGTTSSPAIQIGAGTIQRDRCEVRGLAFGQASGVTAVSGNCGLCANSNSNIRVSDVTVFNFPAAPYGGILFQGCTQFVFDKLDVQGCIGTGIIFQSCGDIYGSNSHSDANGQQGWYFDGYGGGYFSAYSGYYNNEYAWLLNNANESGVQYFFVNCVGDTSGNSNWYVAYCEEAVFLGCWGSSQKCRSVNTGACGFDVESSGARNIQFIGCQAYWNNGSGFNVGSAGGSPSNVQFVGCFSGTNNPSPGGPNGQAGSGCGFSLGSGATGVQIVGGSALENVSGAVTNNCGATIRNLVGYVTEAYGSAGVEPNGSGDATIAHGCSVTPSYANAAIQYNGGWSSAVAGVVGINSSEITVVLSYPGIPGPVTTRTWDIYWEARV